MKVLRTVAEIRAYSDGERAAGRRVALVPTMGALHAGHLSLVEEGARRADAVVVTIFVNPTQFAPGEDFDAYPRGLESDLEKCRAAGVAAVFAPEPGEMYPDGPGGGKTWVNVEDLSGPLCGASRPTFFRGVATVVTKLLVVARPQVAVFGAKDYQQLQVVRRMARDLLLDVEIIGAPIYREPDGLAMSSRNVYLDAGMRVEALVLSRALDAVETSVRHGERSRDALLERATKEIESAPHAEIDYVEMRDPDTLALTPSLLDGPAVLALAVHFPHKLGSEERVRLIDNRVLSRGGLGGS